MNNIIDFLRSDTSVIIIFTLLIIEAGLLIYTFIKTLKLNKKYENFLCKLSNGEDFEDMLKKYIVDVENVKGENRAIKNTCKEIEKNLERCIQKVGIVRYSAFQNTGSDLCFALALLDFEDNGIIINGIYSRDNTTTTYAKPIEKGTSKYTLVKEEEAALEMAKHSGYKYYININNT